jgi:hypothetical protein
MIKFKQCEICKGSGQVRKMGMMGSDDCYLCGAQGTIPLDKTSPDASLKSADPDKIELKVPKKRGRPPRNQTDLQWRDGFEKNQS